MKLSINKKLFLQSWGLAERSTSSSSSMSILSSVLVKATQERVTLQATDIRTSIICTALGINVMEPGEAVFPVKKFSERNRNASKMALFTTYSHFSPLYQQKNQIQFL